VVCLPPKFCPPVSTPPIGRGGFFPHNFYTFWTIPCGDLFATKVCWKTPFCTIPV
jgi:hypothetical protein